MDFFHVLSFGRCVKYCLITYRFSDKCTYNLSLDLWVMGKGECPLAYFCWIILCKMSQLCFLVIIGVRGGGGGGAGGHCAPQHFANVNIWVKFGQMRANSGKFCCCLFARHLILPGVLVGSHVLPLIRY